MRQKNPLHHHQASGRQSPALQRTGLARALSKLGYCSRSQAWDLVTAGRVRIHGKVQRDPEWRLTLGHDAIEVDGQPVRSKAKVYLMLNKPRGLITTASDEHDRETVFRCLADQGLPWVSPIGRLDKASEGLLLFTNDTAWAAHISAPESHLDKTYHVQIDRLADEHLLTRLREGLRDEGDFLAVKQVHVLRHGSRNSWLEMVLDEGKNRHIRRLLAAENIDVLRLIRVAIGPLALGTLAKGHWRHLSEPDIQALSQLAMKSGG